MASQQVHGSRGRSEAFPIVLQLLMDNPDGLTITEISNYARNHGLVEETEISGVATQTRVRRAINSMIELGYAVEAGKAPGGKAMRYKIEPPAIQQDLEEGMLEILTLFQKKFAPRLPGMDGDQFLDGMRKVMTEHNELLGMKLREVPVED